MSLKRHDQELGTTRMQTLVLAALDLTAEHDVDQILERVVRCAAEVTDSRYAALGVYDSSGNIERFVHHGIDAEVVARIGASPSGLGLLGEMIVADGPIRLVDLATDARSCGFPPHHPPMRNLLGVPVRIGHKRYGNLYLSEKLSGGSFDTEDEQLAVTIATFAAAAIEGALLVVAERERASAVAELAAAEARAHTHREMLGRVIDAQEAERARVARDLHDEVGQGLTSVLLGLRLVTDSLQSDDLTDAFSRVDEVRNLVVDTLEGVRRLAFDLRPTVLDDVGLVPAVRRLVANISSRDGISIEITLDGLDDNSRFPPEVETVVYRVVQEALTNVVRHAHASRVAIAVMVAHSRVHATITDDGIGIDSVPGAPRSLGLAGMEERSALVGGSVQIGAAPGGGTRVVLEVPIA